LKSRGAELNEFRLSELAYSVLIVAVPQEKMQEILFFKKKPIFASGQKERNAL